MEYVFFAFLIILFIVIFVEMIRQYINLSHGILCLIFGVFIGPFGIKILDSAEYLKIFAEFGILLLMFSIGLEISFRRLKQMKHLVLGIGIVHSALMIILCITLLMTMMQYGYIKIMIIGMTLSFSSTAVVIQILSERKELNSKIGKISFAILLLQDIIAVLLFVMMGILSSKSDNSLNDSSIEIQEGIIFVALTMTLIAIIVASPKWIGRIVNSIQQEYRPLFALFALLGTSLITQFLNLSSDLGAFIIGMCCASTPWSHEISQIIAPYRIFTLSTFFLLIGVEMNITFVISNILEITKWISLIIFIKTFFTILLMRLIYRLSWSKSFNIGLLLTGCGEFAFVVFSNSWMKSNLSSEACALFNTITGLSMIISPILYSIYRYYFHTFIVQKLDGFILDIHDHSDIYSGKINQALAPVLVEDD